MAKQSHPDRHFGSNEQFVAVQRSWDTLSNPKRRAAYDAEQTRLRVEALLLQHKNDVSELASYCKKIDLDLVGLMCIPPTAIDPEGYFEEMNKINKALGFAELSMGMSSDFLKATKHLSTCVRIGSRIFGPRS